MGGWLELVARFPNRSPLVIEWLAVDTHARAKARTGRKARRGAKRMETRAARDGRVLGDPGPASALTFAFPYDERPSPRRWAARSFSPFACRSSGQ
jgi:hypothetical protein